MERGSPPGRAVLDALLLELVGAAGDPFALEAVDAAIEQVLDGLFADRECLDWLEEGGFETGWLGDVDRTAAKCWCFYGPLDHSLRRIVADARARARSAA